MEKTADESVGLRTPRWRWVTGLRLITSAFVLGSLFLLRFHGPADTVSRHRFESGLAVIGLYIILAILLYRYSVHPGGRAARLGLQIVSDLTLAICVTLISGGWESPFTVLFLIAIINSSLMGGLRLALTVATFSAALWGVILSLDTMDAQEGRFLFPLGSRQVDFFGPQAATIIINTGACYLVAVLSGHLAGQLTQSRRALRRSQARLDRLSDLNESMEAEVKKAERLAALGEMAAGLAHEVRTPLASMTGALHMLQNNTHSPEDQERLMAIIGREMERLTKLSNDFLSFARPSPPRPRAFDLNAAIGEQLKVFECSLPEGRTLTARFQALPPVYFDPDKFIQILWNLLSNALEAGAANQELHISLETALDPNRPRHALMKISDNGPGISAENIAKIFEPFFSTKTSGGGLGLSTVSRLLHEGGGNISVASICREATAFTVFLPLA